MVSNINNAMGVKLVIVTVALQKGISTDVSTIGSHMTSSDLCVTVAFTIVIILSTFAVAGMPIQVGSGLGFWLRLGFWLSYGFS